MRDPGAHLNRSARAHCHTDYHDAGEFQYYEEPVISRILPNTGPIYGGSNVDVFGSTTFALADREQEFANYVCQLALVTTTFAHNGTVTSFSELRVPAVRSLEDPRILECVTPVFSTTSAAMFGFVGNEGHAFKDLDPQARDLARRV